jgi:hypothetical protein
VADLSNIDPCVLPVTHLESVFPHTPPSLVSPRDPDMSLAVRGVQEGAARGGEWMYLSSAREDLSSSIGLLPAPLCPCPPAFSSSPLPGARRSLGTAAGSLAP